MSTVMSAGSSLSRPPIRVGLIGHGLSGAYFHGPLLEAAKSFRIVLVATARPESLRLRRDAPRGVGDPLSACSSDDVDLVVVASPNDTHYRLGRAALEAGKHVVIDKPFALSAAEADELIALARSRGLLLGAFQNRRLDGDFLALKRVLRDGELGEVLLFEEHGTNLAYEFASALGDVDEAFRQVLPGGVFAQTKEKLSYYNVSAGYNLLPGEVFFGSTRAKASAIYLIGGVGSTKFNTQRRQTINFGLGARLFLTDKAALQIDMRDHVFSLDILGKRQNTQNLEMTGGFTYFF